MRLVEVDGSHGEGGGQILRTAVAFSAIKRVPVRVTKIRAGREEPGLKRQHVSALEALAGIFDGELTGAREGSSTVTFFPGGGRLNAFSMDMETAASITLVLQAVIPAASLGGSGVSLDLKGGTDVPWSPTFDYFQRVALTGYRAIGIDVNATLSRRGYYPRGGGSVSAVIRRCGLVKALDLATRQRVVAARVTSRCGRLLRSVAERQANSAVRVLADSGIAAESTDVSADDADSPGSSVLVYDAGAGRILGSDALGGKGKPAEEVGRDAATDFASTAESGASLDAHLADMLVPLLSLAEGPSRVRIPKVSSHLESGLRIAEQFTGCGWSARQEPGSTLVEVHPGGRDDETRHNV